MTCIVDPARFPTKKSLKEWTLECPDLVRIENPSLFTTLNYFKASDIGPGQEFVVTNHPKRSWFAQVGRTKDGRLYVK